MKIYNKNLQVNTLTEWGFYSGLNKNKDHDCLFAIAQEGESFPARRHKQNVKLSPKS